MNPEILITFFKLAVDLYRDWEQTNLQLAGRVEILPVPRSNAPEDIGTMTPIVLKRKAKCSVAILYFHDTGKITVNSILEFLHELGHILGGMSEEQAWGLVQLVATEIYHDPDIIDIKDAEHTYRKMGLCWTRRCPHYAQILTNGDCRYVPEDETVWDLDDAKTGQYYHDNVVKPFAKH